MRRIPRMAGAATLAMLLAAAVACGTDFESEADVQSKTGAGSPASQPTVVTTAGVTSESEATESSKGPTPATIPTSTPTPMPTVAPTAGPYLAVPGVIKSFPDIPPPKGPNLDPPYLAGDQIQQRIVEAASTYGGHYKERDSRNLVIILDDLDQVDRAIAAIAAYYGPDDITETVLVRPSNKYTLAQLTEWYRIAQDRVWAVDGVYSSSLREVQGYIYFGVVTEKTAEKARAALEGSGIPEDAVTFEIKPHETLAEFPVNVGSEPGIEIELEAPAEVKAGETVDLAVVLVNRGDRTVEFIYNSATPEDVFVFRDGVEVWSLNGRRGFYTMAGRISTLAPGESVRFESTWTVIDNDLEPLAPGEYLIAGTMHFSEEGLDHYSPSDVATEPVPLMVVAD